MKLLFLRTGLYCQNGLVLSFYLKGSLIIQLPTFERMSPHALAATALERHPCRSVLFVKRSGNRDEYGEVYMWTGNTLLAN